MKISQKQAGLLAREVHKRLAQGKTLKVPAAMKEQIKAFVEKRRLLYKKKADVQEEINRHGMTLKNIIGNINNVYDGDSLDRIIEKVEEKNIPRLQDLEDEIILLAMFANEDDMNSFVEKIVSKYKKIVQNKVLSN